MEPMESANVASQFDRLPPSNIDAEMCVLASLMLEPAKIPEYAQIIPEPAFFQADHQIIFRWIREGYRQRKALDPIILREVMDRAGVLEGVGGIAYLAHILNTVPSAAHLEHYTGIVLEKYRLRQLIEAANKVLRTVYHPACEERSQEIARAYSLEMADIAAGGADRDVQMLGDVVKEVYGQLDKGQQPLYPFGYADLDHATGGGGLGEMIIVGARPSMGKSTLLRQMWLRAGIMGIPSLYISHEESTFKIGRNLLSSVANVENQKLRKGRTELLKEEWDAVGEGVNQLMGLPLYVTSRHRRMSAIYAVVHAMKAKHGIVRVFQDYLQRIPGLPGKDRFEKVTNASLMLSELFKDTNTNGVVACQLNRALGGRDDKRPTMTDLRESGQIEQDADGIAMLHREDYYHIGDKDYRPTQEAELILEKWRDSARGQVVKLHSDLKFQRFEDANPLAALPPQVEPQESWVP